MASKKAQDMVEQLLGLDGSKGLVLPEEARYAGVTDTLRGFWLRNKRMMYIAGGVAAVGAIGGGGYWWWKNRRQ